MLLDVWCLDSDALSLYMTLQFLFQQPGHEPDLVVRLLLRGFGLGQLGAAVRQCAVAADLDVLLVRVVILHALRHRLSHHLQTTQSHIRFYLFIKRQRTSDFSGEFLQQIEVKVGEPRGHRRSSKNNKNQEGNI